MTVLILIIIAIGTYLSISKPYYYVVWYGLLGSETGARGISGFFETFFPNYTLIMRVLLVIAIFISFRRYIKMHNKPNSSWIVLAIFTIISMILVLTIDIGNLTFSSYISRVTLAIASYGPGIFIIWLVYAGDINHKRLLLTYSVCQCLIAMVIIYGSYLGFPLLNVFNAGLYSNEYFYLDEHNSMVAMPSNFYLAFAGKNEHFIRCGQFHNANGLGFAAGMLMTLLLSRFIEDKNKYYKIIYLISFLIVFLLWCNTGTRGPVVGMFIALIFYVCLHKRSPTANVISIAGIVLFMILFLVFGGNILSYFLGSGAQESWESRQALNDNTFNNISEFFFFGTAGNLDELHARDIDPHELPLRVLCMYGIIPTVLITILIILKPIKHILVFRKSVNFYSLGLFFTILMVCLTNNFAENTLFWISLAEFVVVINESRYTQLK